MTSMRTWTAAGGLPNVNSIHLFVRATVSLKSNIKKEYEEDNLIRICLATRHVGYNGTTK